MLAIIIFHSVGLAQICMHTYMAQLRRARQRVRYGHADARTHARSHQRSTVYTVDSSALRHLRVQLLRKVSKVGLVRFWHQLSRCACPCSVYKAEVSCTAVMSTATASTAANKPHQPANYKFSKRPIGKKEAVSRALENEAQALTNACFALYYARKIRQSDQTTPFLLQL